MYSEYRYVHADATFKNALLVAGAIAMPFVLLTLPRGQSVDAGTLIGFVLVLAMIGALVGTVTGYGIDQAVARWHARGARREMALR